MRSAGAYRAHSVELFPRDAGPQTSADKRISRISWNELRRSSFHSIKQQALSDMVIWANPCSETLSARNSRSIAFPHCEGEYTFWIAPSAHHLTACGSRAWSLLPLGSSAGDSWHQASGKLRSSCAFICGSGKLQEHHCIRNSISNISYRSLIISIFSITNALFCPEDRVLLGAQSAKNCSFKIQYVWH